MQNGIAWQEKLAEWLYRKIGGQDGGLTWGALPHKEKRRYRELVEEFEEEQGLVEEHERDMDDLERNLSNDHADDLERAEERATAFAEDLDKERDKHQETIDKLEDVQRQLRDAQSQLLKAREGAGVSDDDLEKARNAAYNRGYRAGRKKAAADAEEGGE